MFRAVDNDGGSGLRPGEAMKFLLIQEEQPMDDAGQFRGVGFADKIGSALAKGVRFYARRAVVAKENERGVRASLPGQREGCDSIELRRAQIGYDNIHGRMEKSVFEGITGPHAGDAACQMAQFKFSPDAFRGQGVVFEVQYVKSVGRGVRFVHCVAQGTSVGGRLVSCGEALVQLSQCGVYFWAGGKLLQMNMLS